MFQSWSRNWRTRLADRLGREQVAVPRLLGGEEVPAERVGAVAVDDLPRHDDVAERLGHLLALGIGDVAEARGTCGTASGRTAASRSPAASRTSRASGRSPRRCSRPGSAPRSAPGSRTARGAGRTASSPSRTRRRSPRARAAAARRTAAHGISTSSTNGRCGSSSCDAAELLELGERADRDRVAGLVAPDRQRRAPVALARDRPVDVVLQPLAEAPVLDVLGVPVDRLVGRQQPVAQRRRADVPGRLGVVDQRRPAAPAVRVGVQVGLGAQQAPARAQVLDQVGVGVLDPAAGVRADRARRRCRRAAPG